MKGDLLDLRKTGFAPMATSLQPAGIIHHMQLSLLIDSVSLQLKHIAVCQPVVAVEPSQLSCGDSCRDPAYKLQALVGEALNADFAKTLAQNFGGAKGCSHVLALFHLMAAATPRAKQLLDKATQGHREQGDVIFQETLCIDGFQCENSDIEITLQASDYIIRPEEKIHSPVERLDFESNLRLHSRVRAADLAIQQFSVAQRERSWDTIADAPWIERPEWAKAFLHNPIIPGFAGLAMQTCRLPSGQVPQEKSLLLDALLQLAPGYIQIMAALADQWLAGVKTDEKAIAAGDAQATESPSESALKPMGGMPDSCYIWRSGGPLSPDEKVAAHDLKARGKA